jgi:hypothetical protein
VTPERILSSFNGIIEMFGNKGTDRFSKEKATHLIE